MKGGENSENLASWESGAGLGRGLSLSRSLARSLARSGLRAVLGMECNKSYLKGSWVTGTRPEPNGGMQLIRSSKLVNMRTQATLSGSRSVGACLGARSLGRTVGRSVGGWMERLAAFLLE